MTPTPLKAALRVVLAAAALPLVPAAAQASTWTVDDDGAQCSSAAFTSIQEAVDQAAPHDTIIVCDGLYQERSTPTNGSISPTQPGARNGLTIQKPLTIKGTGASKVVIEPDPSLGGSLAGTAPYLRDGGGNVVTISRQSLGASDDDENRVDISGVTIRSPYAYAEAGVAHFNTSGTISASVVGPLRRADVDETTSRPYGWGVVQTNFLQGAGPGSGTVRRNVAVVDSLVTGYGAGGVLFDGARGADGTPESAARAGITQYGFVTGSKIVGGGPAAAIPQTGVRYFAGVRGAVTGSTIQGNAAFSTVTGSTYNSYGVFLGDADTGMDADNPTERALTISGNQLLGNRIGLYNADLAGTAVRVGAPVSAPGNFWGCISGPVVGTSNTTLSSPLFGCQGISGNDAGTTPAPSVETAGFLTTVPTALSAPAPTADASPTVAFSEPLGTPEVALGETIFPVVVAADDFGVQRVELSVDGAPAATLLKAPFEFGWSPEASDAGKTVVLTATAHDSSGQATTTSLSVKVAAVPVVPTPTPSPTPVPPVNTARPVLIGDALVGATVTCLPGSWTASPTLYGYEWLRAGSVIPGATGATYTLVEADTASELGCRVTAVNADGGAVALSATKLAAFPIEVSGDEVSRQVGPMVVTIDKDATVSSKTGKVTVGSATCARALAKSCTVDVSGKVKIGAKSYSFKTVSVTTADTEELVLVLSANARKALKGGKKTGTLSLGIAAKDDTGFKSSWKTTVSVKGTK